MAKRLLYLDDLYDYFSNKCNQPNYFYSNESESPIIVQVHGQMTFEESNNDAEGLLPVHLQVTHTGINRNGSNISMESMEAALPSLKNRPILGYIHEVDGQPEFYTHNMHKDENGEIVFDEIPVGVVPESCNAKVEYDEDKKKYYTEVDGFIYEEYSKASDILEREKECAVSAELCLRAFSFDAKEKCLNIEDFYYRGVTILGKTPEGEAVRPGMANANIKLSDFSERNNSVFFEYENRFAKMDERIKTLESICNINFSKKGGDGQGMFEKLLEKYGKSVEDITFEYDGLSDEELESKFKAEFGENSSENEVIEPENEDPVVVENNDDEGEDVVEDDDEGEDNTDDVVEISYSAKGIVKKFAVSLQDKIYALHDLVNTVYAEEDNTYYSVIVYEEYVIMQDWWNNRNYKQTYSSENDNYTLTGDRVEVYAEFVTKEEQEELNTMRSNYSALKEFKETVEKNELNEKKNAILGDEKYAAISQKDENGEYVNAEFAKLVEDAENYSLADLEMRVKVIHSDYVSEHSNFESVENNGVGATKKSFLNPSSKKVGSGRYGNLFSK